MTVLRFQTRGRHQTSPASLRGDFDCPFCKDTYESELHFFLVCPNYSALKKKKTYILVRFYIRPSAFKMALLLADINLVTVLSNDVSKAFDLRNARSICPGPG